MCKAIEELVANLDFDRHKQVNEDRITQHVGELIAYMDPDALATLIGPELAHNNDKQFVWTKIAEYLKEFDWDELENYEDEDLVRLIKGHL